MRLVLVSDRHGSGLPAWTVEVGRSRYFLPAVSRAVSRERTTVWWSGFWMGVQWTRNLISDVFEGAPRVPDDAVTPWPDDAADAAEQATLKDPQDIRAAAELRRLGR